MASINSNILSFSCPWSKCCTGSYSGSSFDGISRHRNWLL